MQTLLIFMAENMSSHNLSLQLHRTITDDDPSSVISDKIEAYRLHFDGKNTAKLQIIVLAIDDVTGESVITQSRCYTHPLKPKIVINKPVPRVRTSSFSPACTEDALPAVLQHLSILGAS